MTIHLDNSIYSTNLTDDQVKEITNLSFKDLTPELLLGKYFSFINDLKQIVETEGFYKEEGCLYMDEIPVSIPKVLATKILETKDESELQKLKNFWAWLSLNPNTRSRESVYEWIDKHGIQLTPGGMMILYRRVLAVNEEPELTAFVSQEYHRRKQIKKSTSLWVYFDGKMYFATKEFYPRPGLKFKGNLKNLFHSPEKQFTDNHTRTCDYRLGIESRMPRDLGDEREITCSSGFHLGSPNYSFYGMGDTSLVCICNPKDILNAMPNSNKLRTCAFTPISVLKTDAEWKDNPKCLDMIDKHLDGQIDQLQDMIENYSFKDYSAHEIFKSDNEIGASMIQVLKILNS